MENYKLIIDNSFSRLEGQVSSLVVSSITELLTYQIDIGAEKAMLFGQLKMAKRYGNRERADLILLKIKHLEATQEVCWFKNLTFPTGHLNLVLELLKEIKSKFELVDTRKKPGSYLILGWQNKPHELRYYQREMVDIALESGRGVLEAAVGSGKSLIMAYLIKNLAVNSLVVVPSGGLSEQLYRDLSNLFGTKKVEVLNNKRIRSKAKLKPIRVITIQSLAALKKSGDLSLVIDDIDALFIDEFHHSGSESFTNLLSDLSHVYYKYGFTGTFMRNDHKTLDMWGFLSNRLYSYPANQAIQDGFLTPVEVNTYDLIGRPANKYQIEYDKNYCGSQEILDTIARICEDANPTDQILILVNKKDKGGKIISEFLTDLAFENTFISGDDSKEVINNTISDFNEKKIKILLGSNVIGEGIDVRSSDHLIMAMGGKSEIVIVQAVGRAVRLFEGKKIAKVHDFNFLKTKYMHKHYLQRKSIYERNFQPTFVQA